MDGSEVIPVLGQSPHRLPVLAAIRDGPTTNRRVRDDLGLPRTTVRNNIERLVEAVGSAKRTATEGTF